VCARSRPVSASAAATHETPPRARAAVRVLRGAQRALPLTWPQVFAARLPAGPQVAGSVFLRAVWCRSIAGDGRRCSAWK
jgi:hypothetical protein